MKDNADKKKLKGMLKDYSYDMDTLKQSYGLKQISLGLKHLMMHQEEM